MALAAVVGITSTHPTRTAVSVHALFADMLMVCPCCVLADFAMPVERSEPVSAEAKAAAEQQWFAAVNAECTCSVKCGDEYRTLLQKVRTELAAGKQIKRTALLRGTAELRRKWHADSAHCSKASPTSDVAAMPRELLPRLCQGKYPAPQQFPYLSRITLNDVKGMRRIRGESKGHAHNWSLLQKRLQQYADTGAGSIAEAIVYNDYQWLGQCAHEPPSGGRSAAVKRRYAESSASAHAAAAFESD